MRVIAGTHRGARIAAPKGLATRPTGDRVREAAFNLIGPVDDARVLDLFAGSGAMGIEALSRGAASVTFVESDRAACRTISENLERLASPARASPAATRSGSSGASRAPTTSSSSIRPTRRGRSWSRSSQSTCRRCSRPTGVLVVETGSRTEPALPLPLRTSRRYGSARLTLFEPSP